MNDSFEYICDKCNGTGIDENNVWIKELNIRHLCKKCNGKGKLDWLENIFGKSYNEIEVDPNVISQTNPNEKGSMAWCMKRLEDGGTLKLIKGNFKLDSSIEIPDHINLIMKDSFISAENNVTISLTSKIEHDYYNSFSVLYNNFEEITIKLSHINKNVRCLLLGKYFHFKEQILKKKGN